MYAQVTESDSAAAPRGDQPRGSAEVVNGVTPEPRGPDTSGEGMISGMGNPNLLDSVQLGDRPEPTMTANDLLQPPRATDPPYGNSDMGAHVMTTVDQAPNTVLANGQTMQTPATPTSSTVRVQEFFTARSPPGQEAQGIRWMARFSEFLRTTATRGVNSMDRMLDGLGIPQLPATARPANVSSSTPTLRMNVSPPEELPATVAAIPGSWATTAVQEQPLFGPVQMAQMRQAQLEFPQLYGPVTGPSQGSEGESERSSRLQAEVQRQLEEYQQRYQGEMERLQREVVRLREERDGERLRRQAERALGGLPQRMYQKGIMATYLRVLMYQKGIMATYLRVLMYQKGIMAHYQDIVLNFKVLRYLRVLMYQKGIMEPYHYLSEWGFMEQYIQAYFQDNKLYRSMRMLDTYSCLHYLRVLMYQEGIMAHYLRVPMYQEGIMAHYLRVPMYQEGIMDHYLRGVMEMAQVVIQ